MGEYKSVSFRSYLNGINWFIKISMGYAHPYYANIYNLNDLLPFYRRLINRVLCNYLKVKKYNIPKYINTLFTHYSKQRYGVRVVDYHPIPRPSGYVSFWRINSDKSIFPLFRVHLFYDFNNKIISPKKVKKVFPNCTLFYDQDNKLWEFKESSLEWYKNGKKESEILCMENKKGDK